MRRLVTLLLVCWSLTPPMAKHLWQQSIIHSLQPASPAYLSVSRGGPHLPPPPPPQGMEGMGCAGGGGNAQGIS